MVVVIAFIRFNYNNKNYASKVNCYFSESALLDNYITARKLMMVIIIMLFASKYSGHGSISTHFLFAKKKRSTKNTCNVSHDYFYYLAIFHDMTLIFLITFAQL